jgi:hypothetical protein
MVPVVFPTPAERSSSCRLPDLAVRSSRPRLASRAMITHALAGASREPRGSRDGARAAQRRASAPDVRMVARKRSTSRATAPRVRMVAVWNRSTSRTTAIRAEKFALVEPTIASGIKLGTVRGEPTPRARAAGTFPLTPATGRSEYAKRAKPRRLMRSPWGPAGSRISREGRIRGEEHFRGRPIPSPVPATTRVRGSAHRRSAARQGGRR